MSAGMSRLPKDMGASACELISDAKVKASAGHDPRCTYTMSGFRLAHGPCGTGRSSVLCVTGGILSRILLSISSRAVPDSLHEVIDFQGCCVTTLFQEAREDRENPDSLLASS